ncbi:hypothetical protein [uncultured Draconibacterium sp.]|uniref:hypothetical protein n=1 Tax=uncultured Draconibacterium sp. TaxID=1573823 RepID=UPI0032615D84
MVFSVLLFLYFKFPTEKGGVEIKQYSRFAFYHERDQNHDEPEDDFWVELQ